MVKTSVKRCVKGKLFELIACLLKSSTPQGMRAPERVYEYIQKPPPCAATAHTSRGVRTLPEKERKRRNAY